MPLRSIVKCLTGRRGAYRLLRGFRLPAGRGAGSMGMTLIEIMIIMAVIGLVSAATVMGTTSGILGAKLQAECNRISGMVRYGYNQAVLKGKVYRIVFDLAGGTYQLEEVEEEKDCPSIDEKEEKKSKGQQVEDEASGQVVSDTRVKVRSLPKGLRISAMLTKHNKSLVEDGQESVYLFPDGTAEKAFVWLTDGEDVFTVEVTALQGTGIVWKEDLNPQELEKR